VKKMKKEPKYNTPAHKRAQENFAKAQAEQGLVRVQLWVPSEKVEAIKLIAKLQRQRVTVSVRNAV
jgi:hypothetical protein